MRNLVTRWGLGLVVVLGSGLWGPGVEGDDDHRGPKLEIRSPGDRFVTGGDSVEVTVEFDARRGHGRAPRHFDTIVLTLDGAEVGRFDLPAAIEEGTHTFTVDLSAHAEGESRVQAEAYRDPKRHGPSHAGLVGRSPRVRLLIDRDLSDGADVGRAGGVLTTADGKLTLTIPPGALGRFRQISAQPVDPASLPPLPDGRTAEVAYELLPHGLQFALPVEVRVTIDGSARRDDGSIGHSPVVLLNLSGGVVEALEGQGLALNGQTGAITAAGNLSHFSTLFALILREILVQVDIPTAVDVGQEFTANVRVTDPAESSVSANDVVYRDPGVERLAKVRSRPDRISAGTRDFIRLGGQGADGPVPHGGLESRHVHPHRGRVEPDGVSLVEEVFPLAVDAERGPEVKERLAQVLAGLAIAHLRPEKGRELVARMASARGRDQVGQEGLGLAGRQADGHSGPGMGLEPAEKPDVQPGHGRREPPAP